jgi:hypothetical protein
MSGEHLNYDEMVETALRGVVRQALGRVAAAGLPGSHHFYITFRTDHPGVTIADHLLMQFPHEITVVLQYQFWDLKVEDDRFTVTLSFSNRPERIQVPFAAVTAFVDPSVDFGLQFGGRDQAAAGGRAADAKPGRPTGDDEHGEPEGLSKGEKVVNLDLFRKK